MQYSWESQEAFDAWHLPVMQYLRMPYPNRNSKTGEVDENASWTTAYTELKTDDNGVLFAKVEDNIAKQFADGLGTPHTPYFNIGDI